MRGSIRKRGATWGVVYDEPTTDGRRRQRTKGGFPTRREAQRFLAEQLARIDRGSYSTPSAVTIGDFLRGEWLPAIRQTVRPTTITRYESAIRALIVPRIGQVRLQQLSAGHLNGLYSDLADAGAGVASRRLAHAVLSRALRDAERWGRVSRNVARSADPPRAERTKVRAWTETELRRFLEHVRDDRLAALWRLAATTGMRRGELLALTWRTVDPDAHRVSVERQLLPVRGRPTFGPPKSNRSRRTVAVDAETARMLADHRDRQLAERALAGDAYDDQDLVFCDALGGPIRPQWLTDRFRRLRDAAGIPVGTLHVLRHTAATVMLSGGVPVHIAAARLGDRPETVLNTYAHLLPQSDDAAARLVAETIGA